MSCRLHIKPRLNNKRFRPKGTKYMRVPALSTSIQTPPPKGISRKRGSSRCIFLEKLSLHRFTGEYASTKYSFLSLKDKIMVIFF